MNQVRNDVLNGWKEIAAYLGRDPRTVERWEKQRSLPVRRLPGSGRATVYALISELDEWLASGSTRESTSQVAETTAAQQETGEIAGDAGEAVPVGGQGLDAVPRAGNLASTSPVPEVEAVQRLTVRRWAFPVATLAVIFVVGLGTTEWKRRHIAAQPMELPAPLRVRKVVPSSQVPGVEELYLRGCYQTELRTPEALHRAQDAFAEAIRKDPGYAPGYAGLASAFILLREYSVVPDAEAYPRAMEAATKAITLNPNLPQAHAAKGFVDFFWRWDVGGADREFGTALRLDPNLPLAHHWRGSVLLHEGQFHAGLAELELAQRLDPGSAAILTIRAMAMGLGGQRDAAVEMLQEAVSADGSGQYRNPATMHAVLAMLSLLPPRDVPRYLAETTLAAELRQDTPTVETMQMAGAVYRARGQQAMWRALLENERRRHAGSGPTYAMARYETELGLREDALRDLAQLLSRHDPELIGVSVDPLLAPLRAEPKFVQLRAAMGLPRDEGADSAGLVSRLW